MIKMVRMSTLMTKNKKMTICLMKIHHNLEVQYGVLKYLIPIIHKYMHTVVDFALISLLILNQSIQTKKETEEIEEMEEMEEEEEQVL